MKRLRDIIKEKGLTNRIVAEGLGISETNIRRYDDLSKRNIEDIEKVAKVIGVSLTELLNLAFEDSKFIIIDEPELNLHPVLKENISTYLKEENSNNDPSSVEEPLTPYGDQTTAKLFEYISSLVNSNNILAKSNQKLVENNQQVIENNQQLVETNNEMNRKLLELIQSQGNVRPGTAEAV